MMAMKENVIPVLDRLDRLVYWAKKNNIGSTRLKAFLHPEEAFELRQALSPAWLCFSYDANGSGALCNYKNVKIFEDVDVPRGSIILRPESD